MKTDRPVSEAESEARVSTVSAAAASPPAPPEAPKPKSNGWKAKRAGGRNRAHGGAVPSPATKVRSAPRPAKIDPQKPPYVLSLDDTIMELADVRRNQCKAAAAASIIVMTLFLLFSLVVVAGAVEYKEPALALILIAAGPMTALPAGEALKIISNRRNRAVFNRSTGRATFYEKGEEILSRPWAELFFCIGGRGLGPGPVGNWEIFNLKLIDSGILQTHSSTVNDLDYTYYAPGGDAKISREQLDSRPAYLFCHLLRPDSGLIEATWAFGGSDLKTAGRHWRFISDFMEGNDCGQEAAFGGALAEESTTGVAKQ